MRHRTRRERSRPGPSGQWSLRAFLPFPEMNLGKCPGHAPGGPPRSSDAQREGELRPSSGCSETWGPGAQRGAALVPRSLRSLVNTFHAHGPACRVRAPRAPPRPDSPTPAGHNHFSPVPFTCHLSGGNFSGTRGQNPYKQTLSWGGARSPLPEGACVTFSVRPEESRKS